MLFDAKVFRTLFTLEKSSNESIHVFTSYYGQFKYTITWVPGPNTQGGMCSYFKEHRSEKAKHLLYSHWRIKS